jgi:hypothetical protein
VYVKHVIPKGDLIDHDTSIAWPSDIEGDDCICGPHWEFVDGGAVVLHHALDGLEREAPARGGARDQGYRRHDGASEHPDHLDPPAGS